ncbi:iron-containing alcohol dehydrogenase [Chloroflexota bacterium]
MITVFEIPTKIVFGPGSIGRLGDEAVLLGKRPLIVTYPDIRRVGLLDRVVENLEEKGISPLVFDEVEPNPRSSTVDRGARLAREEKVDLVIGLGGGSAMDTAKGITLGSTGSQSIWHYVNLRHTVTGFVPSLIQVPTMAGTGSEVNAGAVITNWETHEKVSVPNSCMWAKVAVIDPEVTTTLPEKQTASGGVDIFSHLVENYLMPAEALPVNDAIREAIMKIVVKYLPLVLTEPENIEFRTQISWASTIAMSRLARIGGTVGSMTCHAIEHAVSGYYDVTHGEGLAALLPPWMRHLRPARQDRFKLLGENVFGESDGISAFEDWLDSVGMKLRLRDLGCELERVDEIAETTVRTSGRLHLNPVSLDAGAIAGIYREAY